MIHTSSQATEGFSSDAEKEKRMKERLCFNCGKPGHMARACNQRSGKKTWKKGRQLNATFRGQLNATRGSPHDDWVITNKEMEAFLATTGSDDESEYSLVNDPLTRLEESFARKEATIEYYGRRRALQDKGAHDYPSTMETFLGDLPSFVEHYQAIYSQKNRNEITEEEFRKLALATLEEVAADEYLMNYNPT